MNDLVRKFRQLEVSMSNEKGPFDLFALFLRDNSPGKWDIVVAADWIVQNKDASLKYIAGIVQKNLSKEDLLKLSRIVIIDEDNPHLEALHDAINIEHGTTEVQNSTFFGLQIQHAYLITSRKRMSNAQEIS